MHASQSASDGRVGPEGDVFLDPETLEPYSGTAFSTFDEQPLVIEERLTLRDGTYDGPHEAYFANRRLSSKEVYENGRKHGSYVWYSDTGRLFEEGTYHQGVLDGPYEVTCPQEWYHILC